MLEINKHIILAPLSGIIFGLGCLIKPQTVLLPFVLFTLKYFKVAKKKIQINNFYRFVTLYIVLFMTILPWLIRNFIIFGNFVFISTSGGVNLYIGNNPKSTGTWMTLPPELANISNEATRDTLLRNLAIDYIFTHPLETLIRIPAKLFYALFLDYDGFSWNEDSFAFLNNESHMIFLLLKLISELFYVFCLSLFIFFIFRQFMKREMRKVPKLGISIIFYFLIIIMIFFGIQRYHFAIIPWMIFYISDFLRNLFYKESDSQVIIKG